MASVCNNLKFSGQVAPVEGKGRLTDPQIGSFNKE